MNPLLSPTRVGRSRQAALATLLVGISVVVAAPGAALANLVQNGSFELGPDPNQMMTLPTGSTAIQGWTVMGGPIDYVDEYWAARDGTRSLSLNVASAGGIAQSFLTLAGQPYQVKFFLSGDPFSGVKHVRAAAAGQSQDYAFDAEHVWPWDLGWAEQTFNFTANAGTTTLTFTSLDAGDTGPALDSVVVTGPSPVGVDDRNAGMAFLSPAVPNPSPGGVTVSFTLPNATSGLRLAVHDARGRTVRLIASGSFEAGTYVRAWDGRTATGERAAAGLYFVRLTAPGDLDLVRKAILAP